MKLTYHENSAYQAVRMLLKLADVRFTEARLQDALLNQHDFPGIGAICEVLEEYRIANLVARIDQAQLAEVPLPALAYTSTEEEGNFVTIKAITGTDVVLYHPAKGWVTEPLVSFARQWTGVVLLIEPDSDSGEEHYRENKLKENFAGLRSGFLAATTAASLAAILWLCLHQTGFAGNAALYFLLGCKLLGLVVTSLLLTYEVDKENALVRRVCQLGSRGCDKVLNAEAARPFWWLSWSEVGYFYFASGFLFLILSAMTGHAGVNLIFVLSCLALPYTLYSVFYQARVARQWCPLCLSVQALLWIEFFTGLGTGLWFEVAADGPAYGLLLLSLLLVTTAWVLLKPHAVNAAKYAPLNRAFQQIRFHPNFVGMQQQLQKPLPSLPQGMETVVIGKADAQYTVVMIMNPLCSECAKAHQDVERLLQKHDNIQCRVVLSSSDHPDDEAAAVASQILSMPGERRKEGLRAWFETKQLAEVARIPVSSGLQPPDVRRAREQSLQWIASAGLTKTPAFYVNDVEYPDLYKVEEIGKVLRIIKNAPALSA